MKAHGALAALWLGGAGLLVLYGALYTFSRPDEAEPFWNWLIPSISPVSAMVAYGISERRFPRSALSPLFVVTAALVALFHLVLVGFYALSVQDAEPVAHFQRTGLALGFSQGLVAVFYGAAFSGRRAPSLGEA